VALQEVDCNPKRTSGVDRPAELARLTKMQVVFGDNIPYQGGRYGNAVLSRLSIVRHENHPLPSFHEGEQRGVLEVAVLKLHRPARCQRRQECGTEQY
jgi:endonuclease/exonuclease/phosphatase family metal-dependent hydrolase